MDVFRRQGLTILEILIVIAVMMLITAITFAAFSKLNERHLLNGDTQAVVEALNSARGQTLSREDNSIFGVHIESNRLIIFKGETYSHGDSNNETVSLSGNTTLTTTISGNSVLFEQLTGETLNTGTITITTNRSGLTQVVTVYGTGVVSRN